MRNPKKVFTVEELAQFDGSVEGKPIYLALLGQVFDVSKGGMHYAKNGGYGFFSGKDGSAAFVTGKFNSEGLTSDLSQVPTEDYIGLKDWVDFYNRDYTLIGVLNERFYDEKGNPTQAIWYAQTNYEKALILKEKEKDLNEVFPPCNSRWSQNDGGKVWCSTGSGGVKRDWIGFPRLMRVTSRGKQSTRCACVPADKLDDPNFSEYQGCHPEASLCQTSAPGETATQPKSK